MSEPTGCPAFCDSLPPSGGQSDRSAVGSVAIVLLVSAVIFGGLLLREKKADAGSGEIPVVEVVIRGSGNAIDKPHGPELEASEDEERQALREVYPGIDATCTEANLGDGIVSARWHVTTPIGQSDLVVTVEFQRKGSRWYSGRWQVGEWQ